MAEFASRARNVGQREVVADEQQRVTRRHGRGVCKGSRRSTDRPEPCRVRTFERRGLVSVLGAPLNLALGLCHTEVVTWGELIRKLKVAGFIEQRTGKGSRQFMNPTTKKVITVAVHTKREVGTGLAQRILKDAGLL